MPWKGSHVLAVHRLMDPAVLDVHVVVVALTVVVGHVGGAQTRGWRHSGQRSSCTWSCCPESSHSSLMMNTSQDVGDWVWGGPTVTRTQSCGGLWGRRTATDRCSTAPFQCGAPVGSIRWVDGVVEVRMVSWWPCSCSSMMSRQIAQLVPENPGNWTDTGHIVLVTHPFRQQSIADLPCKDARILLLQLPNVIDDFWCCYPWLGAPNGSWEDWSCLMVSCQNLRHASMAHAQLARNITRSDAQPGQLHNPHPSTIWQWTTIHKDTPQLIHLSILLSLIVCKEKSIRKFLLQMQNIWFWRFCSSNTFSSPISATKSFNWSQSTQHKELQNLWMKKCFISNGKHCLNLIRGKWSSNHC